MSPSDLIQTPCTAKLSSIKQNRFNKYALLFAHVCVLGADRHNYRSKPIVFAFNKGDVATQSEGSASPLGQTQHSDVTEQNENQAMGEDERAPVATRQSTLPPAEF